MLRTVPEKVEEAPVQVEELEESIREASSNQLIVPPA
jgi:hypothetical protein